MVMVMVMVMVQRSKESAMGPGQVERVQRELSLDLLHDQVFGHEVMMFTVMDIAMFSVSVYAVLRSCTFFMIRIMSIHHYCNGQVTDRVVVMNYGSDVL